MLTERYEKALIMACRYHASQCRKGSDVPYVTHLLAVSGLVLENGGGETEAIAALLHDAAEDAGGRQTLEEIRAQFGDDVAHIVDACTDTYETPKPPWIKRKQDYLATIPGKSAAACLVSCADKVHNARCILFDYRQIGEDLWTRFNAERGQVLWYYRALADAFAGKCSPALSAELKRVVDKIHDLAEDQSTEARAQREEGSAQPSVARPGKGGKTHSNPT